MNVTDFQEIWQVDAGGQIYEARFEELTQWIWEGSLLPQDMVRRGNLRWIEARKVPALMQTFNARDRGDAPPVFTSTTDAQGGFDNQTAQTFGAPQTFSSNPFQPPFENNIQPSQNPFDSPPAQPFQTQNARQENPFQQPAQQFNEPARHFNEPVPHEFESASTADYCSMHPDMPTEFLCGTCGNGFCKVCPKSYGGTVKICPFCGALCKSVKEVQEKTQAAMQYDRDISRGFGAEDFFAALSYPFRYKTSLIVGAVMFLLFSLGQGAGSMGSIFLAGSGLVCWMMSNMLTFGVMANTVENFAQGKVGGDFMPSFDDFSIWDDVVHPFFLSLGVYLISFGLVIVIIIVTIFWGLNQMSNAITDSYQPENAPIVTNPNSPIRNNKDFQKQDDLYGEGEMPDEEDINRLQNKPGDTENDVKRTNDLINDYRKKQLESGLGKSPETEQAEREQFYKNIWNSGALILLLLLVGIGWGLFYSPVACLVAGYTRSFVATINPAIGFETIKLLGWDYVKLWLMGAGLTLAFLFISFVVHFVLSPFNLPTFGNIPAKIIGSFIYFYIWVVYSVLLGFLLYKNADKMNLFKG